MNFLRPFFMLILTGCVSDSKTSVFQEFQAKEHVVIYLKRHQLEAIPKEIGTLKYAKRVEVSMDSAGGWVVFPPLSALMRMADQPPFSHLPKEITHLENLEYLALFNLNIRELPENFERLQKLDTLILSLNKLTITNELEKLTQLRSLKYLSVYGNKITPDDVQKLKQALPNLTLDIETLD